MRKTVSVVIACAIVGWTAGVLVGMVVDSHSVGRNEVPEPTDPPLPPTLEEVVDDYESAVVENSVESVQTPPPLEDTPNLMYTKEEQEILAIIIYQEAGGDRCSDDTRRKVGSVFLNRVNSSLYPDTFSEVALQKQQYGTLYWTGLKWPDRVANAGEAHAVERAYKIAEELLVGGSILPDNVIFQAEFTQGDGLYCYQDGIYFCYKEVDK